MKYLLLLIILSIQVIHKGNSQDTSRFDLFAGYGFYEGFNIGAFYNPRTIAHSAGLSFGYSGFFNKKKDYIAVTAEYKIAIMRSRINEYNEYKWHLDGKIMYWYLEDEFYIWKVGSVIPSLARYFSIGKKIGILADAGVSFNLVLYNKRKTYKEAGWPYHYLPNFRIIVMVSL